MSKNTDTERKIIVSDKKYCDRIDESYWEEMYSHHTNKTLRESLREFEIHNHLNKTTKPKENEKLETTLCLIVLGVLLIITFIVVALYY